MSTSCRTERALGPTSVVSAAPGITACNLGDETVILAEQQGIYYGLNKVGTHIWQLFLSPRTVADICAALETMYAVSHEQCEEDVLTLLKDLHAHGLIEVVDA
jgi:hypothetical protein